MDGLELKSERNEEGGFEQFKDFDFGEFLYANRTYLTLFLLGLIFLGLGAFLYRRGHFTDSSRIEVLEVDSGFEAEGEVVVEIAGAVEKPGVYKLESGGRVEDLLIASGGISADADRDWVEKFINRAAKLVDGQKLYIPAAGEQSSGVSAKNNGGYQGVLDAQTKEGERLININTASQSELESMWGIGPVFAQNIIEHRPYSTVEELLTKEVIRKNVYERNKDLMTAY